LIWSRVRTTHARSNFRTSLRTDFGSRFQRRGKSGNGCGLSAYSLNQPQALCRQNPHSGQRADYTNRIVMALEGWISQEEFFDPEKNLKRIFANAGASCVLPNRHVAAAAHLFKKEQGRGEQKLSISLI
jgi:hypothetical protein